MKKYLLALCLLCATTIVSMADTFTHITVEGNILDNKGNAVSNVMVTDGRNVTITNQHGHYSIQTGSDREFIYYSTPSGYISPIVGSIPLFYKDINPSLKNQIINFELIKRETDDKKHRFIVWGDPQIYQESEFSQLSEIVKDLKKTIDSSNLPTHALSVGDNVFDKLQLNAKYIETISDLNIPFYHVIGNHDMNYNKRANKGSDKTYKSHFGPSFYSFNVGNVHYVVLNDVFYYGFTHRYIGYITDEQLSWLEKDLQYVPQGSTIVLSLHIPTKFEPFRKPRDFANELTGSVMNRHALYNILNNYNTHIMAGHSHVQWKSEIKDNLIEHVHSAASGAWWQGDICTDGNPKGYYVYDVENDSIKWHFKGLNLDKNEQFRLYVSNDTVIANVFNHDSKWKVEYYEDGKYIGEMEQFTGIDPISEVIYKKGSNKTHKWLSSRKTGHLFKAPYKNPNVPFKVIATDRFGNKYIKEIAPYKLVWNDEFNNEGKPNEKKWNFETYGNKWKWGNNEAQHYTNSKENAFISNGTLKIIAKLEDIDGSNYTSARLSTKGKGDWKYGKIDVRAKLPDGAGAWSAIWMLPSKNFYGKWPASGEIDIMESVGYDVDSIFSTAHTLDYNHIKKTQKGGGDRIDNAASKFHDYSLEWDEYEWRSYVDGELIYTYKNDFKGYESWPFDKEFYLILNLAIGGNLGNKKGIDNSQFPKTFEIDYVRVYQRE